MILRRKFQIITVAVCTFCGLASAQDSSRTNLGLYGGTVMSTAFDQSSGSLFAAVAGPLSLFVSNDTGASWKPAFPTDSLKWMDGPDIRGWAGRGMNVWSKNGTTICRSVEEGGVLWAFEITNNGIDWHTLWDNAIQNKWRTDYRTTTGNDPFPGSANCAAISNGSVFLGINGVILHSANSGGSWNAMPFPSIDELKLQDNNSKHSVVNVIPSEELSKIFVIAAKPGSIGGPQNSGSGSLWVTSDSGKTWDSVLIVDTISVKDGAPIYDTISGISSFHISTASPDTIYFTNSPVQKAGIPTPGGSLWMSSNGGDSWVKIASDSIPGVGQPQGHFTGGILFYEDSLSTATNKIRIVSSADYSDDLGVTWTRIKANNGEIGQVTAIVGHIPDTDVWFGRSDMGPKTGSAGIDGTYELGTEGMVSLTISRVAQLPDNLNRVYLATNTGIAYTTKYLDSTVSNEDKWKAPHGKFPIVFDLSASVADMAINPWDPNMLLAASGNGLSRTTNGGLNKEDWVSVQYNTIPGWIDYCWVRDLEFFSKDTAYAATRADQSENGGLLATFDGGVSWQTVTAIGNRPVNSVTVAYDSTGNRRIFVGTGKGATKGMLFISDDAGASWDSIPGLDACNNPGRKQLPVRDVEVYPGSLDTFFIACGDNTDWAVGWTYDGGDSIAVPSQKFGGAEISKIAVNKNHPDSVYFAMRNQICLLDFTPIDTSIKIDTLLKVDTLMKGDFIIESPQFFQNWFVGYPGEILYDIHYDELMMASSVGAFGVKSNQEQVSIVPKAKIRNSSNIGLQQRNGNILLSINSLASDNLKVQLYDLRGRVIATLFNGTHKAGISAYTFPTKPYGAGCYILSVTTGTERKNIQTLFSK